MEKCKIGIVGVGVMASGTAALTISNGYPTVMYARTSESCEKGIRNVTDCLDDLVAHSLMTEGQRAKALTLLSATTEYAGLADCAFVVESVPETIAHKSEVMRNLEAVCAPDAILTSTTSAISANEIVETMTHKERFMVAHSWNPPHLVPLVEIVKSQYTSQAAVDAEVALMEELGRVPVVMEKDAPGFIGNRLHHALFREAEYMIDEGICTAADIDKAFLASLGPRYNSIGLMEYWDHIPVVQQRNIQSYLFPHLCSTDKINRLLADKIETGENLYDWTPEKSADYEDRKRKPFYEFAKVTIEE